MTEQPIHPMQPSAEQFDEWLAKAYRRWPGGRSSVIADVIARLAYAAGADAELEACIAWFDRRMPGYEMVADQLRAARRPKPPSLKEQALLQLDTLNADLGLEGKGLDLSQIRRALETLPDD